MNGTRPETLAEQMHRVAELVAALERQPLPAARVAAQELTRTLLALHRAGLARLLDGLRLLDDGEPFLIAAARDELIGGLLLLHGLHPVPALDRVRDALDRLEPSLRTIGATVVLQGVADGVLSLRIDAEGHESAGAAQALIEQALVDAAPDLTALAFEGAGDRHGNGAGTRIPLPIRANRHE
jgi:hypothetical protein